MIWIQEFAGLNGVTQPVNGSWIQAICEAEGITQPINGTWIEALARNKGATATVNGSWINALAVALGITQTSNGTWIQALAENGTFSEPLGTIIDNDFTVGNWTKVGPATFTNSGSTIAVSGGTGVFTNYYVYNYYSCLEKAKWSVTFTVNSTGASDFGIGIGLKSRSTNDPNRNVVAHFVTTGASKGKVNFYTATSSLGKTSTGSVNVNNGNSITVNCELDLNFFKVTVLNNSTLETYTESLQFNGFSYPQTLPFFPNTWSPALFAFGGSQTVTSFNLSSEEMTRAEYLVIGDSKSKGYFSLAFNNRFGYLLDNRVNSGASDKTGEVVLRLPEIVALNPKRVILFIGCNDVRFSVPAGTWQANFNTINSTLAAAGITVYNCLPIPEDSINLTTLKNWIDANLSNKIDLWTPFLDGVSGLATAYDVGDGVHPNQAAQSVISTQILNSI
jgi:lysophospholipase L1-like esterase